MSQYALYGRGHTEIAAAPGKKIPAIWDVEKAR
jgi:hypothetical protein